MTDPFFILSLPRSRSAWLATWLSYNGRPCWHDMLGNVTDAYGLKMLVDKGAAGFAETAGSYFPRSLLKQFPRAKFLVVERDAGEVAASLVRLGKDGGRVADIAEQMLVEAVDYLKPRALMMHVAFDDLDNFSTLAAIWRFLRNDPFPVQHTTALLQMRVTKLKPFAGQLPTKLLIEEDTLRETLHERLAETP